MTPEQLDEIENRQAAAVWIGGPTAAFAQDTLLLVKALREALIAADAANRERADWMHSLDRSKADIITLMRERDAAKAEAERLRDVVRQVHALADVAVRGTAVWEPLVEIHKITKEMSE